MKKKEVTSAKPDSIDFNVEFSDGVHEQYGSRIPNTSFCDQVRIYIARGPRHMWNIFCIFQSNIGEDQKKVLRQIVAAFSL